MDKGIMGGAVFASVAYDCLRRIEQEKEEVAQTKRTVAIVKQVLIDEQCKFGEKVSDGMIVYDTISQIISNETRFGQFATGEKNYSERVVHELMMKAYDLGRTN